MAPVLQIKDLSTHIQLTKSVVQAVGNVSLHIEAGETAEQAAVREVEEETGIIGCVVAPLGTIDFWFVAEDRRVHKTVHHFLLRATGGELSDEDIEVSEVAWVPLAELESRLAYADERRLIRRAAELLEDSA